MTKRKRYFRVDVFAPDGQVALLEGEALSLNQHKSRVFSEGDPHPLVRPEVLDAQPQGSEVLHSQPQGSEVLHSQPQGSEVLHSQPQGSEVTDAKKIKAVDSKSRAAGRPPQPIHSGSVCGIQAERVRVVFPNPRAEFLLDISSGSKKSPTQLSLHLAELEVWLADAGGLDLGGLPVVARGEAGEVHGRIGAPILLWPGSYTLCIGDEAAGVCFRDIATEVNAGRNTVDLGRLASLVVTWGEGRGWPVRAVRLEGRPEERAWLWESGRREQSGRLGEPIDLWPGRYRVEVDGGPTTTVEVHAGRLLELDLSSLHEGALVRKFAPLRALARDASLAARKVLKNALPGVGLERLLSDRLAPVGGDARAELPSVGPSLKVLLRDARGYFLTGLPCVAREVKGAKREYEGRIGLSMPLSSGCYLLEIPSIPGFGATVEVEAAGTRIELPALGALRVIFRDGLARSFRGARFSIEGEGWSHTAVFGQPVPLMAGSYEVRVEGPLGIRKSVDIESGQICTLDLGAMGRLQREAGDELAWGSELWIERDSEGEGALAPLSSQWPVIRAQVGRPLDLPPGDYRLWIGAREGEGMKLAIRAARNRRPTVHGRGFEVLVEDDFNRDLD